MLMIIAYGIYSLYRDKSIQIIWLYYNFIMAI